MRILISGDSFGAGVLEKDGTISHPGLTQFLKDAGHDVVNISQGGISNLDIWKRIKVYFERFPDYQPDLILVFQSEWHRDYKHVHSWTEVFSHADWNVFDSVEELQSRWISRFYSFLSEISTTKNVPVYIIGGAGDAIWLDNMADHYPGCCVAVQSWTNLLLNNGHRVLKPVFGYYSNRKESDDLIKHLRATIKPQYLEDLVDDLTRAYDRLMIMNEHPELFWPDGSHPNQEGHRLLFEFLKKTGVV